MPLVPVAMLCGVTALEAVVRLTGFSVSLPSAQRSLLLAISEHVGELAVAMVAGWVSVRRLSLALGAASVILLGALAARGGIAGGWSLMLSGLVGALDVCVWAYVLLELRRLDPRLGTAAFLLAMVASNITQLFAYALGSGLGMTSALHGAGAATAALVLALGLVDARRQRRADAAEATLGPIPWGYVVLLFALSCLVKLGSAVMAVSQLAPVSARAAPPLLPMTASALAALCLLVASAWLGFKHSRPRTSLLAGTALLLGAALATCALAQGPWLAAVAAFGRGMVSLATSLLLLSAALLMPARLLPLLVAIWFLPNMLVGRLADHAYHWASGGVDRPSLISAASIVLVVACAATLLLSATRRPESSRA